MFEKGKLVEAPRNASEGQAMDEFCRKTKIITGAVTFNTTADLRWYGLPDNVVEVVSVDFDGYKIPRLVNQPEKRDLT